MKKSCPQLLLFGLFVLAVGVLAGCGNSAAPATDAPAPGNLVIYSGRSESLVGPAIEQFRQASGINVEVRYGSTSEIAALLLEEGSRTPADLFFAQDPAGLGAVQKAGLLAALPASLLEGVSPRFIAPGNDWVGVSGRARVVVYNTDAISDPAAELPADIFDFVDPQWKGRLGWAPTNGSFQAMVTAMRAIWGEEKTAEWLRGIQANQPVVYQNNTGMVTGTAAGESDVAFTNHYYLYRYLAEQGEGFKARNYFLPGGGPGSLIMVSGVGVLKSAANPDSAQQFVAWLLSDAGQGYFAGSTSEYPVRPEVVTLAGLPPLAELDGVAATIDISDYTDLAGTVELMRTLGILP
jgi:iron(III) transport system substrate-binding protein